MHPPHVSSKILTYALLCGVERKLVVPQMKELGVLGRKRQNARTSLCPITQDNTLTLTITSSANNT